MPHFESDAQVYDELGGQLTELARAPELRRVDAVVQWRLSSPDATITLDLREAGKPQVDLGDTELQPEVVLATDADVARALWAGELSPMLALARGAVRTKGPVAKVLKLVPPLRAAGKGELEVPEPEPEAPVAEEAAPAADAASAEDALAADGDAAPAEDAAPAPIDDAAPEAPAPDAPAADGDPVDEAAKAEGGE